MKRFAFAALGLMLAACATTSPGTKPADVAPAGPLDFGGDWRHDPTAAVIAHFEQSVSGRYAAGSSLASIAADLHSNQFTCVANHDTSARGDPPAQICRRTVTEAGCTYTWQVHLFDTHGDAHLARSRELYDKRCGNDALLGGPS